MATFVKTPSGTWKALIRRKGFPSTIRTFSKKRDAENWARGIEDEMARGLYFKRSEAERMTLSEALDRYLAEVTVNKKTSTAVTERGRAKILKEHLGKYALVTISPVVVARYRDQRLATISPRTGRPITANSVRLELALLSHLLNTAIREWGIGLQVNPVVNVAKPKPGSGRDRRLTRDEQKRLLEACDATSNPMLGWIVRIALETAMRRGEIMNLRPGDVDLNKRVVKLRDTKNSDSRDVPLNREATRVFQEAVEWFAQSKGCTLLFSGDPGRDGQRRAYGYESAFKRAVRQAGLENFRFHDLRHEAVSRLVEGGLADQEVAAISGHKSMQMVRRYTHLRGEDLVAKLDAFVSPRVGA